MMHMGAVDGQGKKNIDGLEQKLVAKFQAVFYPFQDIASDEMLIGYKGRWEDRISNRWDL